ncbi:hypothetical protein [Streptomyces sp. ST2-7A]|uniref:hypothetical protein n=1 Tax=Streptomyces sp. ST2-7A TaxID=2907214 RepID=UPI001F3C697C|nr:hypothetical protein [Streptomyces sp. ST2-7A]MCE7078700.1 hypothetical protein [Streptomyces sp. ST2-7A]
MDTGDIRPGEPGSTGRTGTPGNARHARCPSSPSVGRGRPTPARSGDAGGTTLGLVLAVLAGAGAGLGAHWLLDQPVETSGVIGGTTLLLFLIAHTIGARGAGPDPSTGGRITETARQRRVEVVAPPETEQWLRRARRAADRLDAHRELAARRDGSDALANLLSDSAAHARVAADQLVHRAEAVTAIDTTVADGPDTRELRGEHLRLTREIESLPKGPVRRAKETSARAVADRAASRERLEELRVVLMAELESLALHLETAAEHGGALLSLRTAGDLAASNLDLTPLTTELEAVREGLDRMDSLTRDLLPEPPAR